jgi:hypothetical protein
MENFNDLVQRLLEIQSPGRPRSQRLIAENKRSMNGLKKRNLAGKTQTQRPDQYGQAPRRAPRNTLGTGNLV